MLYHNTQKEGAMKMVRSAITGHGWRRVFAAAIAATCMLIPSVVSGANQIMKIGWSTIDITPTAKRVMLWGFDYSHMSQGIHDTIHATAMAIESASGDMQAIMISLDLGSAAYGLGDDLRTRLSGQLSGFNLNNLYMFATHSHAAPFIYSETYGGTFDPATMMTGGEYRTFLLGRLATVAQNAWNNRSTATVSWLETTAVVGWSRIGVAADGTHLWLQKGDHYLSNNDNSLKLLFTYDTGGNVKGVMVNTATPAQCANGAYVISSDMWGEVRSQLAAVYPGIQVLPMCAFAGDQGPWDFVTNFETLVSWTHLTATATKIANAVKNSFTTAQSSRKSQVELNHIVSTQTVPNRPETGGTSSYVLHTIRIGDVAIVNSPAEYFYDYGVDVESRSLAPLTFTVQLSSDAKPRPYMGYIPTAAADNPKGVYSERPEHGAVGSPGGQMMANQIVSQSNSMFGGSTSTRTPAATATPTSGGGSPLSRTGWTVTARFYDLRGQIIGSRHASFHGSSGVYIAIDGRQTRLKVLH